MRIKKLIHIDTQKEIKLFDKIFYGLYEPWIFCGFKGDLILAKKYPLDLATVFEPSIFNCKVDYVYVADVTFDDLIKDV